MTPTTVTSLIRGIMHPPRVYVETCGVKADPDADLEEVVKFPGIKGLFRGVNNLCIFCINVDKWNLTHSSLGCRLLPATSLTEISNDSILLGGGIDI